MDRGETIKNNCSCQFDMTRNASANMRRDIEVNLDFYNSLAVDEDEESE